MNQQSGWELAERLAIIGATVVAFVTALGAVINRFYKFVTWTDLRRTITSITDAQKSADIAAQALIDERHATNLKALAEIKQILAGQNRATYFHRETVNRSINSLVTDMAVVKKQVEHLERNKR